MALVLLTFLLTTLGYGALALWAFRRVAAHLKNNAEGVKSVADHVVIPLLGKDVGEALAPNPAEEKQPEGPDASADGLRPFSAVLFPATANHESTP